MLLLSRRRMGQISNEHQGHLDTFTLVKIQTDSRLVVKNDQLWLFVSRCGHIEQAINLLLLAAFLKMHFTGGFVM